MSVRTPDALLTARTAKGLDRTAEDLEGAAARHGLSVIAIHELAPGLAGCRVYEVCHARGARAARDRLPDAAILVPCRVLLRSEGEGTLVTALRPAALLRLLPGLEDLAEELEAAVEKTVSEATR
jgi:uncharacterized protein (DUF302 family)